jgi:hypothetical protein
MKPLEDLKKAIYDSIPGNHDSDKLNNLIDAAKAAREGNDEPAYVKALLDLTTFHKDSFADDETYTPLSVKGDSFLEKKSVAIITARTQKYARSGNKPQTVADVLKESERSLRNRLPNISALFATHTGWDVIGPSRESQRLQAEFSEIYKKLGASDSEASYKAMTSTTKELNRRRDDVNAAVITVKNAGSNNEIYVHMDADSYDPTDPNAGYMPKATQADIDNTIDAMRTATKGGLFKDRVVVHLLPEAYKVPNSDGSSEKNTAAFTYDGSDHIFAFVDRINALPGSTAAPADWWSTDIVDSKTAYGHIISHEVGHLLKNKLYGAKSGKSETDFNTDVENFSAGKYTPVATPEAATSKSSINIDPVADLGIDTDGIVKSKTTAGSDLSGQTLTRQLGSNPGGFTTDPTTGETVYVKVQKSELHAQNETLAAAFYAKAGLMSADTRLGTKDGQVITYAPNIPNAQTGIDYSDKGFIEKLQKGYAMDALLANWDSMANDANIMRDMSGNPIWIDPGGSLLFRAQGARKTNFGDTVSELDSLITSTSTGTRVYGSMTPQQKTDSAKLVQQITHADIDILVNGIITDPVEAKRLRDTLKNRRDYILKRFNLELDLDKARADAHARSNQATPTKTSTKLGTPSGKPEPVSGRGTEDFDENFAELYARFVQTDDEVPQWFVDLLASHGISKRTASKLWRANHSAEVQHLHDQIDKMLDPTFLGEFSQLRAQNPGMRQSIYGQMIAKLNGTDGEKPEVVKTLDSKKATVYRGVHSDSHRRGSAAAKAEVAKFRDEFINGLIAYMSNTTVYGSGTYSSTNKSTSLSYSNGESDHDHLWQMNIKPGAKLVTYGGQSNIDPTFPDFTGTIDTLKRSMKSTLAERVQNEMFPDLDTTDPQVVAEVDRLMKELPLSVGDSTSNIAGLLGYDGVELVMGRESYVIYFNRGIFQILDPGTTP